MGPHTRLGGSVGVMRRLVTRSSLLEGMAPMLPRARKVEPFLDSLVEVGRRSG